MSIAKEYFSSIKLGEIRTYKNMTTVGLKGLNFPDIEYLTLSEGIDNGNVRITEIDELGSVPSLNIINNGDLPVLLIDGEELKGAKQNRVLNTTILIPEYFKGEIPVSCTEEGRWRYDSPNFVDAETIAPSRIRESKSESVSASLNEDNSYRSNQGELWDKVSTISYELCAESPTKAMNDVFETKKDDLDDYIKEFPFHNQNGVLVFINGKIKGMDILSCEENYEKYHKKIIKSFCLDALADKQEYGGNTDFIKESNDFINEIATINMIKKPSIGYGYDCRFVNENIAGAILVHEDSIIHGAFFKKMRE